MTGLKRLLMMAGLAMPVTLLAAAVPLNSQFNPSLSPLESRMNAGITAFERGDHEAANAAFRLLASHDVPAAETLLGTMAANGQGGPKDEAVAAAWFLRAARRGYAPAQLALADAFAKGRGVARNPERAMALAQAAAAQNQPGAAQWIARNSSTVLALSKP